MIFNVPCTMWRGYAPVPVHESYSERERERLWKRAESKQHFEERVKERVVYLAGALEEGFKEETLAHKR